MFSRKNDYRPPQASTRAAVRIGSPRWVLPVMLGGFIAGLLWLVAFYIAGPDIPLMNTLTPLINVGIGFGFVIIGFVAATRWR